VAIFREVSYKGYVTKCQKPLHKLKKGGFKMYGSNMLKYKIKIKLLS